MLLKGIALTLVLAAVSVAQEIDLLKGRSLDAWEKIGDGIWDVTGDGVLVGQRDRRAAKHQAWLYTKKDYAEYDLEFEYWIRHNGNSGISIRDTSRAAFACGDAHDGNRTPSHIGYEIQIYGGEIKRYPTGSLYLFQEAKTGMERYRDWNRMKVSVRNEMISVHLNGQLVMQHPGDPNRSKRGPIGLQLHDPETVVMFRNVRVREAR